MNHRGLVFHNFEFDILQVIITEAEIHSFLKKHYHVRSNFLRSTIHKNSLSARLF